MKLKSRWWPHGPIASAIDIVDFFFSRWQEWPLSCYSLAGFVLWRVSDWPSFMWPRNYRIDVAASRRLEDFIGIKAVAVSRVRPFV
jgi:hypothetical protein